MSATRGSKEVLCQSIIESLRVVKTMQNHQIRNGIDGIIHFLESQANKHKPLKNK